MHKYYTRFEWLDAALIDELLPTNGIPESLEINDLDDEEEAPGFTRADFEDWLWEGRHDSDVAFAVLRLWISTLRGNGNATLQELFDQLLEMHAEKATGNVSREVLPVSAIAAALQPLNKYLSTSQA